MATFLKSHIRHNPIKYHEVADEEEPPTNNQDSNSQLYDGEVGERSDEYHNFQGVGVY